MSNEPNSSGSLESRIFFANLTANITHDNLSSPPPAREWWWREDSVRPDYTVPDWAHVMAIVILSIVFISGAVANIQVLVLLYKHRDFWSPTNALIVNMVGGKATSAYGLGRGLVQWYILLEFCI